MVKATAIAHANIAFIKYWGVRDAALRLPANNSLSINLDAAYTTTTVEFAADYRQDVVVLDGVEWSCWLEHWRLGIVCRVCYDWA